MADASVPCGGCTHCCQNELIMLHPEMGDDPERYHTQNVRNPLTGQTVLALEQKPNGDCGYLGSNGCTIHPYRPAICREFDCRRFYNNFMMRDRNERKRWRREFKGTTEQVEIGRQMLEKHPL